MTGFAILAVTALASGAAGDWLARRPRLVAWQRRVAGAVLIGLGVRLLFAGDPRALRG